MTEDVSAGRLHMDVVADPKGMSRGLQAKVNAEMAKANVRAKVKAEIDAKGLAAEAKRAAAAATKAAAASVRVKIKAEIDQRSLDRSVVLAAKAASAGAVIKYKAEVDQGSLARAQASVASVTGGDATVNVDADTGAARAEVETFRREAGRDVTVNVKANTSSLKQAGTALVQLSKIPALVGGFYTLGTAIVAVGGGLVAMTSSALSASTALAAIPNIAGAGITALATLLTGFSGIGEAVKQMGAVQATQAQTETSAAAAREGAARRVADAQRALGDALRAAKDGAKDAAEAVRDAQYSLARSAEGVKAAREGLSEAQYHTAEAAEAASKRITRADENVKRSKTNITRAETALNRARENAAERIRDLNRAMQESALDEESAAANLQRAREDLQDVNWNEAASPQERRDAEMAVKEAERQLLRVQTGREELAEATADANAKGVDGADEVVAAEEAIKQANEDQLAAVEELRDARKDAKHEALEASRQIRDAEYAVRDALHAQQEAREALADAQQAKDRQAQASARAIADAQRALADAQKNVGVVAAEQTAAQTALATAMDKLSPAGQRFATFLADVMLPRLHEFKLAIQEALLPGIQEGLTRAMPLLNTLQTGMTQTARILGGFATSLGTLFGSEVFNTDVGLIMQSNNRMLRDFLASVKNLIEIFVDLAVVAGPTLAEPFMEWIRTLTRGWKQAAEVNRESGAMAGFFERAGDRAAMLKDILGNLFTALYNIGVAANPTGDSLLATFERTTQKWRDWTGSDLGKARMEEFFEAVEPTTRAIGDLVAQLSELLIKTTEGNAKGGLAAFIETLTMIVNGLNAFADLGGGKGGVVLGWIMTIAGVGGALGLVSGMILRMVANFGKLFTLLGGVGRIFTGAFSILMKVLGPVGRFLYTLGWKLVPYIIRLAPLVGRAVALMFGPWGIAIAAVIGLFILLYKKVDWFRAGVDWVVGKIVDGFNWLKDAAFGLWDHWFGHSIFPDIADALGVWVAVIKGYFTLVKLAFKALGAVAEWLWDNAIKPAFNGITKGAGWLWEKVGPVLENMWKGAKVVGGWFRDLWKDYISPAWDSVKGAIENGWNNKIKPALGAMWEAAKDVGGWFRKMWNDYISPAWESIKTAIDNGWNNKIKPALQALEDFATITIPNAFSSALTAVKNFWDDVKAKAKVPIKFVLDTVWNNGLRKMIGYIPGVSEPSSIDVSSFASGTRAGAARLHPGRDVHQFTSPTGGRLNLSGGEAIMRPEFTNRLGDGSSTCSTRPPGRGR